jgi:hypothetical protein
MKTVKKTPTLAEVKAVVRAWVKANWPDARHVTLTEWCRAGGGENEIDLLGPPTREAWFTNDIPMTKQMLDEGEARAMETIRKRIEAGELPASCDWLAEKGTVLA